MGRCWARFGPNTFTLNDGKARLTLSAAAQKVLEEAASPRKRGEFVSRLLLEYGAGKIGTNALNGIDGIDLEGMKLQLMGLASANKTLDGRVLRLEKQLAGR
jgi:hypothetical protein